MDAGAFGDERNREVVGRAFLQQLQDGLMHLLADAFCATARSLHGLRALPDLQSLPWTGLVHHGRQFNAKKLAIGGGEE